MGRHPENGLQASLSRLQLVGGVGKRVILLQIAVKVQEPKRHFVMGAVHQMKPGELVSRATVGLSGRPLNLSRKTKRETVPRAQQLSL